MMLALSMMIRSINYTRSINDACSINDDPLY